LNIVYGQFIVGAGVATTLKQTTQQQEVKLMQLWQTPSDIKKNIHGSRLNGSDMLHSNLATPNPLE